MKLKPETIAAHQARHQRERRQLELPMHMPRRFADTCPRCRSIHMCAEDAERCRQANMQREQY